MQKTIILARMINRRPAVTSMRMTADDIWAVVLVLPLLSLAFGLVCFGTVLFRSPGDFAAGYFPTLLLVSLFHVALVQISYAARRRYPTHRDTAKRLVSALILYLLTSFIAIHFSLWIYDAADLLGVQKTGALVRRCMVVALVGNLVNAIMYDLFYTFAKMKEALVAKEGLEKEHLRQQFDALKTQVNPHFLFNNLNTLSELIEEDPDAADEFLNEMSKVYRYMLRSRDQPWVPLHQELLFFRSYFHMLTVRYGIMVAYKDNTGPEQKNWQLPSLTLQLIAEEAIRTSQFSKKAPLLILLDAENDRLVLTYFRKPKIRVMETEGLDWNFLSERFTEGGLSGFAHTEEGGNVVVTLPVLLPQENVAAA